MAKAPLLISPSDCAVVGRFRHWISRSAEITWRLEPSCLDECWSEGLKSWESQRNGHLCCEVVSAVFCSLAPWPFDFNNEVHSMKDRGHRSHCPREGWFNWPAYVCLRARERERERTKGACCIEVLGMGHTMDTEAVLPLQLTGYPAMWVPWV